MTDLDLPHFKSEAEEADWWYDNRHQVEANFVQAASEGKLQRRDNLDIRSSQPTNHIAVEPNDADLALAQAQRKGLSFEDHAKRLFHRAVQAEEQERVR